MNEKIRGLLMLPTLKGAYCRIVEMEHDDIEWAVLNDMMFATHGVVGLDCDMPIWMSFNEFAFDDLVDVFAF